MPQVPVNQYRIDMVVEGANDPDWPSNATATAITALTNGQKTCTANESLSVQVGLLEMLCVSLGSSS